MSRYTTESAMALSDEQLINALDELVRVHNDLESDTAELLTALVMRKKMRRLNKDMANRCVGTVMILVEHVRKYKAALELILGIGSEEEQAKARAECVAEISKRAN